MEKDSTTVKIHHFINKSKAFDTWIKVGYELFAKEGPEGIHIERLARILDRNKSGFYHYFGNHDTYFQHLMQHHLQNIDLMVGVAHSMHQFLPEFAQLLSDFSIPVLAQKQLQRACHIPLFAKTYDEVNNKIDPSILSLWADFMKIPDNPTLALRYLEFVRDLFYARVTPATLNFEFIYNFLIEAREVCDGLRNSSSGLEIAKQSA